MRNHHHTTPVAAMPLNTQIVGPRFSEARAVRYARRASELWEERVQAVARAFRIDLKNLLSPKSAPEKVWAAVVMKRITSVANRWLAERRGQQLQVNSVRPCRTSPRKLDAGCQPSAA